jgi:hypothetical protein
VPLWAGVVNSLRVEEFAATRPQELQLLGGGVSCHRASAGGSMCRWGRP